MTDKTKIILVGCSWFAGEWQNVPNTSTLEISHPGLTEYLSEKYSVVNLSRGSASNWQSCYTLHNYLTHTVVPTENLCVIVGQTDAARYMLADKFDVNYNAIIARSENLVGLYTELSEIFYIKLLGISQQFSCKVHLVGGLTDLDLNVLGMYPNINVLCQSWIKLLDNSHKESTIPLILDQRLVKLCKINNRLDLCDEIFSLSESNFLFAEQLMESNKFGPAYGDFHPSRVGHKVLSEYLISNLPL